MMAYDYFSLLIYLVGIFLISGLFAKRMSGVKDMFAAGRQSPWWASGLSGFMTMFSAGTFVVWGGIAYRLGLVAVMINMCYGIAALLVGYFVAGRWNQLGVTTPAEYVRLRFGMPGLHFFTWTMLVKRLLGVSVSLYSLGILLVALVPLPEGAPFRDPLTGHLSFAWAVVFFGLIVVIYTMLGGLWAVLMTDVLQFIVLTLVVFLVAALTWREIGDVSEFVQNLPPTFFHPVSEGYGWIFLMGWVLIHFFMVGAEWAFVQRFLAVRSPSEARKSSYLFGIMYLVTPFFWLLPPLLYRGVNPDANPEQAYILAAQSVLPAGMLGFMFAAMFSATASMVSSQLNVFAGVLTNDFYKPLIHPEASDGKLVRVGRVFTFLLGALLVTFAVLVPRMGGAERLIISINSLLVVPLFAPTLWGLFSRKIGLKDMGFVALSSFALGAIFKFGLLEKLVFLDVKMLNVLSEYAKTHPKNIEVVVGVLFPLLLLCLLEWRHTTSDRGWTRVEDQRTMHADALAANNEEGCSDLLPVKLVTYSVFTCGGVMLLMTGVVASGRLIMGGSSLALLLIGFGLIYLQRNLSNGR